MTELPDMSTISGNKLLQRIQAVWSSDRSAPALEFEGRWLTWGELRDAALAIDHALTEVGIGVGAPVGIFLRNRPGLIAALLAVLMSQRCIVSLSPFQPAGRQHEDLRKLKLPAVIADAQDWAVEGTVGLAQDLGCLGLSLEQGRLAAPRVVSSFQKRLPHHEDLSGTALEILTSGTTGAPKRIRISYRTMEDSIVDGMTRNGKSGHGKTGDDNTGDGSPRKDTHALNATPTLKATPTVMFAPLMHVSGLFGTLLALYDGRPLVLLEKFSVDGWVEAVVRHKVRFGSLPPTPMRMVLDANVPREKLASLLAVRAGTAPLSPQTQRDFESRYGVPVLVQYGATEWMGGLAGWSLKDHQQYIATKLGSVGRANGGVKLRVVDPETGREVPLGETGILEVLPAQRLGVSEWMPTTDLASIDTDGFLYIHGRADDTIIRGGFKVRLNEVAEILTHHPAVLEAAVIGLPDERLGQVPVAAIECKPAAPRPSEAELKAYAQRHLTPYQVPVRFKLVAALPRTISMKVSRPDVRALFEID
jgi:long-chain acyl-CoA synthetase